jgi:predicted ATP-grasp superfamily ATP-dependent carboligase
VPDRSGAKVLVTDASRGSALTIIRSLGRGGWRVVATDVSGPSPGLHSRYAAERLIYPSPRSAPDDFVEAILAASRRLGVDLIIPVTDDALLPLSRARKRFAGVCQLAVPEPRALRATTDKLETIQLAREHGIPVPGTHLVADVDRAVAQAECFGWPVVLKPRSSRTLHDGRMSSGFRVEYAGSANELVACLKQLEGRCDVLLQEYWPGVGHGVEMLLDQGRPLAAFQHERIREIPVHGGASALRRSVALDPALYGPSLQLLQAISWTGLAMVEYKVAGAEFRLIEINGRVWGSLPLAVHSGMDFPARLAELLLEGPPPPECPPETDYRLGVHSRNPELDLMWIASVLQGRRRHASLESPPRRKALAALVQLANPRFKSDVLSLDDPKPGLVELAKIARKFRGKLGSA